MFSAFKVRHLFLCFAFQTPPPAESLQRQSEQKEFKQGIKNYIFLFCYWVNINCARNTLCVCVIGSAEFFQCLEIRLISGIGERQLYWHTINTNESAKLTLYIKMIATFFKCHARLSHFSLLSIS